MASPIRLFLLDDHEIVRRGLRALLESEGDISVVGEAGTAAEGTEQILELLPDVAVLDARLPDGSGIEVCRTVRSEAPDVKALILTSHDDDEALMSAFMAGAAGYVLKQIEGTSLISGVRQVADGQSLIDPTVAGRVLDKMREAAAGPSGMEALTPQELKVLDLIGEGLTNRQIGEQLFLAEKTVKNHVTSVLSKLGVERRTQAAVLISRHRNG